MKRRSDYKKSDSEVKRLDDVNNKRLDNTIKRVSHTIRILDTVTLACDLDKVTSGEELLGLKKKIAHAVNLLEAASEEMRWHCEWFEYEDMVVNYIDDACASLGSAMSLEATESDEIDDIDLECNVKDALVKLSKALATFLRWNDDDVDASEI